MKLSPRAQDLNSRRKITETPAERNAYPLTPTELPRVHPILTSPNMRSKRGATNSALTRHCANRVLEISVAPPPPPLPKKNNIEKKKCSASRGGRFTHPSEAQAWRCPDCRGGRAAAPSSGDCRGAPRRAPAPCCKDPPCKKRITFWGGLVENAITFWGGLVENAITFLGGLVENAITFWGGLVENAITFWGGLVENTITFWGGLVENAITFWGV